MKFVVSLQVYIIYSFLIKTIQLKLFLSILYFAININSTKKVKKPTFVTFYSQKSDIFGFGSVNLLRRYAFKKKFAKHFTVFVKNAIFAHFFYNLNYFDYEHVEKGKKYI